MIYTRHLKEGNIAAWGKCTVHFLCVFMILIWMTMNEINFDFRSLIGPSVIAPRRLNFVFLHCFSLMLHSENEDHGIWSHHFMGNRWENSGNNVRLYFGAPKSLQMVFAALKLKDAYFLEGKL